MFRHVWLSSIVIAALAASGCSRKPEQQSSATTSQQPQQAAPAQSAPPPAPTPQQQAETPAPAPEPTGRPSPLPESAPAKPKPRKPAQTTAQTAQNVQTDSNDSTQPVAEPPQASPAPVVAAPPPAPPKPAVVKVEIPSGTPLSVRMIDSIDSSKDQTGQQFRASLNQAIQSGNRTVVPAGADVYIRLANAKSAGHIKGQSQLELQLSRLVYNGRSYPLVSNNYTQTGASRGKQTAKRSAIGGGIGAAIGAIAGGGKGAAIGAAVGGGGTAAYQLATRGEQVKVPSETVLQFTLQAPVEITKTTRPGGDTTAVRTDEPGEPAPVQEEQPVSPK